MPLRDTSNLVIPCPPDDPSRPLPLSGSFVSASPHGDAAAPCADDDSVACHKASSHGLCISQPEVYKVRCRKSCGSCASLASVLTVRKQQGRSAGGGGQAAGEGSGSSNFRLAQPLTHRYPPGSKVLAAANRHFLVVPLGNLVDERYTVYFSMQQPQKLLHKDQA